MKKMNKKLYVGIYAVSLALPGIALVMFVFAKEIQRFFQDFGIRDFKTANVLVLFAVFAVVQFIVTHFIYTLAILYKMWGSIQDGHARATPGEAIGYLFVPFYNLYWIFQVWRGFPADYNAYVTRHELPFIYLNPTAYSFYPVLILLSAIPYLGILFAVISSFVFMKIVSLTCDAVNALAEATEEKEEKNEKRDQIQTQKNTQIACIPGSNSIICFF